MPRALHNVVNFVAFQAGWFACVLGAARGHAWLGSAAVGLVFALHLALVDNRRGELLLALFAALVGLALETALVISGAARYASASPLADVPPGWIIAMWVLFATALNVSLGWLRGRLWLAALLGAALAPLSYMAGARLGGMSFGAPEWRSLTIIAVLWAIAMPLLVAAAQRLSAAGQGRSSGEASATRREEISSLR